MTHHTEERVEKQPKWIGANPWRDDSWSAAGHPAHLRQMGCLVFSKGSTSTSLKVPLPGTHVDPAGPLKRPHWCLNLSGLTHTPLYLNTHTKVVMLQKRLKCACLWLHWWHCCHLWLTPWEICLSSPAPTHSIWESLGSRDCPDSSRWTPAVDAPSLRATGGLKQQKQWMCCSEPRSRRWATARCPLLLSWGDSTRSSVRRKVRSRREAAAARECSRAGQTEGWMWSTSLFLLRCAVPTAIQLIPVPFCSFFLLQLSEYKSG